MSARAKSQRPQLRKISLRVWTLCWLTLVWVLLWGTFSAGNVVGGLVVALVITLLLPLPRVPVEGKLRPLAFLRLVLYVAVNLVVSSFQVAWLAVKPGPPPATAVLRAHLAIKSDLVLSLAVGVLTLIPGSVVLEIDQKRRLIYVHVLDVGSDQAVERFYRQVKTVERLMVAAFERDVDWRPSAEKEDA